MALMKRAFIWIELPMFAKTKNECWFLDWFAFYHSIFEGSITKQNINFPMNNFFAKDVISWGFAHICERYLQWNASIFVQRMSRLFSLKLELLRFRVVLVFSAFIGHNAFNFFDEVEKNKTCSNFAVFVSVCPKLTRISQIALFT